MVSGECSVKALSTSRSYCLRWKGERVGDRRTYIRTSSYIGNRHLSAFITAVFDFDHSLHLGTSPHTVPRVVVHGGQQCPSD